MSTQDITFTASAITGAGRGKQYGIPTININLAAVPEHLEEGIYACFMELSDGIKHPGAMHYGPRPVFNDSRACEVHLIDTVVPSLPNAVTVTVVQRLRDIRDFPTVEDLKAQIVEDIAQCRAILSNA